MHKENYGSSNEQPSEIESRLIQKFKCLALNNMPRSCRNLAEKFFSCLEENLKEKDESGRPFSLEEMRENLERKIVPFCMCKFNLSECLRLEKERKVTESEGCECCECLDCCSDLSVGDKRKGNVAEGEKGSDFDYFREDEEFLWDESGGF